MPTTLSPLAAYVVVWGISQPLEALKGCFIPLEPWGASILMIALLATALPERKALCMLSFSVRLAWWLLRLPFTWDSEVLTGLTDFALILHVAVAAAAGLAKHEGLLVEGVGESIRKQMGWFYFFAGFWKFNSSFMDHRFSCSSVYIAQLLDAYVPEKLLAPDLAQLAIVSAPLMTVILEVAVGVLMLVCAYGARPRPTTAFVAVALATILHIGIDFTPKPNNIAAFSHKAAIRYFWFAPEGTTAAVNELRSHPTMSAVYAAIGAGCLALTVAAQQPDVWARWVSFPIDSLLTLEMRSVDWHVAAHTMLSALLLRGLWLGEGARSARAAPTPTEVAKPVRKSKRSTSPKPPASRAAANGGGTVGGRDGGRLLQRQHLVVHLNTALCLLWAGGGVISGVIEINTPNMFSNIRMQGGTNHLLGVPTALLQQWRYTGHGVTDDPFSGGIVRVDASSSSHINAHYPAEETMVLTPGTRALLHLANHSGRAFNSAVTRVVGSFAIPPRPSRSPFVPFTLPALEVRRLLRDARTSGEAFEIIYTNLPGQSGDETWRVAAKGRKIRLVVDAKAKETCTVMVAGSGGSHLCLSNDLAIAPFPTRDFAARPFEAVFGFLQSWNSLPILSAEDTELHCYGS